MRYAPSGKSAIPGRSAASALVLCVLALLGYACARAPAPVLPARLETSSAKALSYREDVEPVLKSRCAVCHGCYDAPCQLLATSYDGITRGASRDSVYSTRLLETNPTRLGLDAQSVEAWRALDFVSVVEGRDGSSNQALLLSMLALGHAHTFAAEKKLPDDLPLSISRSLSCPTAETFDDYARNSPMGGMPYGTAPLSDDELRALASWVNQGAPGPDLEPPLPARAVKEVQRWETFLNGDSLKERITARYLYEHWVFAHLHFEGIPDTPFFAIYRSTTPPGAYSAEIGTDSGPKWHSIRANRHSEKSERSDAGILYIA